MRKLRIISITISVILLIITVLILGYAAFISTSMATLGGDRPSVISVVFQLFGREVPTRLRYDINDCKNAKGYVLWSDSREIGTSSNKYDCYQERAEKVGDWETCAEWGDPSGCLAYISKIHKRYVCDKLNDEVTEMKCNFSFSGSLPASEVMMIEELQKYKEEKFVRLRPGDKFIGEELIQVNEYRVDPFEEITHTFFQGDRRCGPHMDSPFPIKVHDNPELCDELDVYHCDTYIYLTSCKKISNDEEYYQIDYYKYNLKGNTFPDGV